MASTSPLLEARAYTISPGGSKPSIRVQIQRVPSFNSFYNILVNSTWLILYLRDTWGESRDSQVFRNPVTSGGRDHSGATLFNGCVSMDR